MQDGFIQKAPPAPALRDYIRQYTFVNFPFDNASRMEFTVMPSSHTRMILFLDEPSLHEEKNAWQPVDRYSLTGFVSRPHIFKPTSALRQVMVHFTAWGVQPFVGFPISEITDTRADLNHVFQAGLDDLSARLSQAPDIRVKAGLLDHFFQNQLNKVRQPDRRAKYLAEFILQTRGALRLEDACKQLFLGERTAQRLVHNAVGVNFKFFARLVRLEHVRRLIGRRHHSLTEVAMTAGYFDQAHFIHDFRKAFGLSPGAYLDKQKKMVWTQIEGNAPAED